MSEAATQRRKARLLATFLCILFVVFGVVDVIGVLFVPGHVPPWYGYVCLTVAWLLNRADRYTSAAALTLAMFPAVMPSTLDPQSTLTTVNAASTPYTLKVLTIIAGIFLPLVILYQSWTYWVFRKRITVDPVAVSSGPASSAPSS